MKLVSITLLRNEEDIVEAFVRYHAKFLDHMVLIDHSSTDATWEILEKLREEGLPLTLREEKRYEHAQAEALTGTMHDAAIRFDADWILPLDADEFLRADANDIRSAYEKFPKDRIQKILPQLYVPLPTDSKQEQNFFKRIRHHRSHETESSAVACIPKKFAMQRNTVIAQGNHEIYVLENGHKTPLPSDVVSSLFVAHFPYRNPLQTERKILTGYPRSVAQFGDDDSVAIHWKETFEKMQSGKRLHYEDLMELALDYPCIGAEHIEQKIVEDAFPFPSEIAKKITWKQHNDDVLMQASKELLESAKHLHVFRENLRETQRQLTDVQWHLTATLQSRSWRLTLPIRKLQKWLRNRMNKTKKELRTTIVVPIFNAYEVVQQCVHSVLLHTNQSTHHLLLIDDASTDERIHELLADVVREYPDFITVLRNENNLGFVQSANLGLRFDTAHDVILLNSDCIVGPQWSELLRDTAQRKGNAASVTSLSNNASIYSVLRDTISKHPELWEVSYIADLVRKFSPKLFPRIPTGVGFCMYVNRKSLEQIGYFDEAFGKGYGEENDWCMRAEREGWQHYLDDRCFVFHHGSASMKETGTIREGETTLEKHEQLLQRRYPQYKKRVQHFLRMPTMNKIHSRLYAIEPLFTMKKPTLSYLLHASLESPHAGGTELHVKDLLKHMRKEYQCFTIIPRESCLEISAYFSQGKTSFSLPYGENGQRRAFDLFFRLFPQNIFHVHHLLGSSFDVLALAKAHNAKVLFSIHDAYTYSENPQPLWDTPSGKLDVRSPIACAGIAKHLSMCDCIVSPSRKALMLAEQYVGIFPGVKRIIPHGISAPLLKSRKPMRPTVCFLGRVHAETKGGKLVEEVALRLLKKGVPVYFLGSSWQNLPRLVWRKRVKIFGKYKAKEVTNILYNLQPSVVPILSRFPETYSYTLTEAWAAGIPTYVTPIGALPERTMQSGAGRVAPSFDAEEIAEDLMRYLESEEIDTHRANSWKMYIPADAEMAAEYKKLYEGLFSPKKIITPKQVRAREKVSLVP